MRKELIDQVIKHEGIKLCPYRCTAGKLTIGVGRNLEDNGITHEEAMALLSNDLDRCVKELNAKWDWFENLDEVRQDVLINMCFNLGIKRLANFRKTINFIRAGQFANASEEMLNSQWATQVGNRAVELSKQMSTGEYQS